MPSLRVFDASATCERRPSRRCRGHACSCRCAPPLVHQTPALHRASGIAFSRYVLALGPGAWGRGSFFAFSPSAPVLPRIYYADYPLGTGMDMHVSDFNGLLVTAPMLVQCLDE